jgi:hypothetical protein
LKEPKNGDSYATKEIGVGGSTFRFIWEPPPELLGQVSSTVGYKLVLTARKNGATLYLSSNGFLNGRYNGEGAPKLVIFDKPDVSALAGGERTTVTWNVTIIQASAALNESDTRSVPPGVVSCGPPSETRIIELAVY